MQSHSLIDTTFTNVTQLINDNTPITAALLNTPRNHAADNTAYLRRLIESAAIESFQRVSTEDQEFAHSDPTTKIWVTTKDFTTSGTSNILVDRSGFSWVEPTSTPAHDPNRTFRGIGGGGGAWVIGIDREDGANDRIDVWETTDPFGTWTAHSQVVTLSSSDHVKGQPRYGNGVWLLPVGIGTGETGNPTLARSTDRATWAAISVSVTVTGATKTPLYIASLGRWILGTGGGYVFTSDDDGQTWTERLDSGLAFHEQPALCPNGDLIISAKFTGELYRSTDDGITWAEDTAATAALGVGLNYLISHRDFMIGLAQTDGSGVRISEDNGATWRVRRFPHNSPSFIESDGERMLYGDNAGDMFITPLVR